MNQRSLRSAGGHARPGGSDDPRSGPRVDELGRTIPMNFPGRSALGIVFLGLAMTTLLAAPVVTRTPFGTMPDGTKIDVFTLTNNSGMEVRTIPYGAILVSIRVPDKNGHLDDVVIGHDDTVHGTRECR